MAIVPSLPVTLQNGTTADATQVMANFNAIVSAVNANSANSGINTNITQLQGLTVPVGVNQGGTGQNVLTPNSVLLGEGINGINAVAPSAIGTVLTSNGPGADPSFQALVLGTMASQNASSVAITGGTINGPAITGNVTGHASADLQISNNLNDLGNLGAALANLGFTASVGTSGWVKFPTVLGGLIIQWGVCGSGSQALPRSFPNAAFGAIGNILSNNGGGSPQNLTMAVNQTNINNFVTNSPSNTFFIAAGN